MSKELFDKPDENFPREIYYYPEDEAEKLENHILGESIYIDSLDIHKIQRQAEELNRLENKKD